MKEKDNITENKINPKKEWYISYKQLGLIIIAFSFGIIATLLFINSEESNTTQFSTTELIIFSLTIILAGASIVLAIAAIALGKSSEQAVIQRSDESIRLQNEVFQKTTDALQRIESSTGVTEKRIEDIISGRVGDLSHKIVEIATEKQKEQAPLSAEEVEKMIRKNLSQSLYQGGIIERSPLTKKNTKILKRERLRRKKLEIKRDKNITNIQNVFYKLFQIVMILKL